ncbi:MAG: nicotinamide mononucleotide transporter [Cyclobacteriaceae bacterium]|nr:nicotinamide mononucleotide transporter [Cyclobacteriaceae bacterium]
MASFFDISNIFFTALGYPMSYLEFFGVLVGAAAVWLSAKGNVWSWPLGIINVTLIFFLVYQVQLYPDMFLQIFFFITNLIGWWRWTHPKAGEENRKNELRASWMEVKPLIILTLLTIVGTFIFGSFAGNLHELFPKIFSMPSAFPYWDSFVAVISITATYLMVQKKVECWLAWILADIIATYLYFAKGIMFLSLEYFVFCLIATFGFIKWRSDSKITTQ